MNDWREDTEASIPELLEHLSKLLVRLDYDLREFQRVLLNLAIFENQAHDQELEPLAHYYFQAPTLQRMSAEQLWDSLLTLLVLKLIIVSKRKGLIFFRQKSKLRKVPSQSGRNVF